MLFIKNIFHKSQKLFRDKKIFLASAVFTFPLSLLISVINYTISGKSYSIPHLIKSAFGFSCVLFWLIWWIVNRKKSHLRVIFFKLIPPFHSLISTRGGLLALIILLLTIGLVSAIEFPQINLLSKPKFKYMVEITPVDENAGNLCIMEIKNSYGNIFGYNETVSNAQNSGGWKRDIFSCDHFLEAGESGKISFENIGPIDDVIEIIVQSDPNTSSLMLASQPGKNKVIKLHSDEPQNLHLFFKPGNVFIREITDWGLNAGYFSAILILFLLIPIDFFVKTQKLLNPNKLAGPLESISQICRNVWLSLDSKKSVILSILLLYFTGVALSVFITNPLTHGPTHFNDEIRYWETALSLYQGNFTAAKFYRSPPFYPISLLPAFYFSYPFGGFTFSKLLNSLYITSAIIPAFLLLRKFTKRNISIVAITLLLFNPVQFIMPGHILSENIFYPLFMWTVLFAFTNVLPNNPKNRVIESLIVGVLLGLLFLTRYIALVLIPAFILIWWLKPFESEKLPFLFSIRKAFHLILIFIPLFLIIGGWINTGLAEGLRVKDMLGFFIAESPNPDQLSLGRLLLWIVFYLSFTILLAAPSIIMLFASISQFKFKDWQEYSGRWLITVAIILFVLLVACIRHSWRINYNYPIPLKLQGRYLLYFGPLFLITIFSFLQKSLKSLDPKKLMIYSVALISFSYAFLFLGLVFIDGPLQIAQSSPDGDLIKTMGISFLILTITNAIITSLAIGRKKGHLHAYFVLFLLGFYLFGNVMALRKISNSSDQLTNSQILNLVQDYKSLSTKAEKQPIQTIYFPKNSSLTQIKLWDQTLIFNGFTEIELIQSNILESDPAIILQAENSEHYINLRELTESEYTHSNNKKYRQSGKFYEYQLEPKN